jgi:3-hydroxy acid dehydrogenase / malonic semialdehyde reductase
MSYSIENKVILITGASSGIGSACARLFAEQKAKLILTARRGDRLQLLAEELASKTDVQTLIMDVRDRSSVQLLTELPEWQNIDILINNAGLSRGLDKLHEGSIEDWEEMIDTNIKGLLYVSRLVIPEMVKRGQGHIVNIGSIAGHQTYPNGNVYCGTKAAVRAISEGMKQDLLGTPIRVTSIDPGMVETEFSVVRFHGNSDRADKVYEGLTPLTPEDIADVILFTITRPPHVNISEMLLVPTDQATATMVYRR